MKSFLVISICFMTACTPFKLKEGKWTGHLTPMNHSDMSIPVNYDVTYKGNSLKISIIGSNEIPVATQNPHLINDTLFFAFKEPEEQVDLECALARTEAGEFTGKCTDSSGKWAIFTMIPPQ